MLKKSKLSYSTGTREYKNIRENIVQCHIREACDRSDTKVGGNIGGQSGNEFLTLTEGAANFNLVGAVEIPTAAKL